LRRSSRRLRARSFTLCHLVGLLAHGLATAQSAGGFGIEAAQRKDGGEHQGQKLVHSVSSGKNSQISINI